MKQVLRIILFGDDQEHAYQAARRLASLQQAWASELLDEALRDSQVLTRYAALRGCAVRDPGFLVPRLKRVVADQDENIRSYARRMLARFEERSRVPDAQTRSVVYRNGTDVVDVSCSQKGDPFNKPQAANESSCLNKTALKLPAREHDTSDYWEWNMTTFNTPKYRRK